MERNRNVQEKKEQMAIFKVIYMLGHHGNKIKTTLNSISHKSEWTSSGIQMTS